MSPNTREAHKLAACKLRAARIDALACLDLAMSHRWDEALGALLNVADDLAGYRAFCALLPSMLDDDMSASWRMARAMWDRAEDAELWDAIGHLETEIERAYARLTGH